MDTTLSEINLVNSRNGRASEEASVLIREELRRTGLQRNLVTNIKVTEKMSRRRTRTPNRNYDRALADELDIVMDNDFDTYRRKEAIIANYKRKLKSKKTRFDRAKAEQGVLNLLVVPQARKYQNEYGVKVGNAERRGVAKRQFRTMWNDFLR